MIVITATTAAATGTAPSFGRLRRDCGILLLMAAGRAAACFTETLLGGARVKRRRSHNPIVWRRLLMYLGRL